jgi:hypothetical protein
MVHWGKTAPGYTWVSCVVGEWTGTGQAEEEDAGLVGR